MRDLKRGGLEDSHILPDSVQRRLVGGHVALSYMVEYTSQGRSRVQYFVRMFAKSTKGTFFVEIPAKADIDDFCKRFDLIVNTLRIP